jgi:2-aminoadipate transaminase
LLDLYLDALERGVAFAPGEAFFAGQPERGYMRLSWAAHAPEQIAHGISLLGKLILEHMTRYRRLQTAKPGRLIPMV